MQYIQIAESVLSKLPSTLQLAEVRTMTHDVRETKIFSTETDNEFEKRKEDNEDGSAELEKTTNEADDDLV